ncbi:unnamed protein product [Orchesella dallaii]
MEMESAIEDAVETAEDILIRMQMMEPERMMEQYCQSINETATESAKTVKNGVLNIFSKILTNVLNDDLVIDNNSNSESYDGQNPLMIDLVLRNVLKYLSIQDLCSCRLVCKLWNTEAGAYVRRKHRIVFSPNCIEKMANFTAFMKAQLDQDYNEEDENSNDKYSSSSPTIPRGRYIPPYTDFSFTAQYPRINFSRPIVRDFSMTYGQYVKKLEIFYPNDSSLSARDFTQFFLQGMPNVQYIHFVNLPTKLTQSSFLQSRTIMTPRHLQNNESPQTQSQTSCNDYDVNNRISSSGSSTSSSSSNNNSIILNNDNTIKDNNILCNKDNSVVETVEETQQQQPTHPLCQDCSLRWIFLTHLKIDRTLLMEGAWSESFLEDLFSTMPNLKHYELWTWNSAGGDGHSNPYFTCLTRSQRENLVSLYPGSVGENLLKGLADYGLSSLKKLHLPVLNGEVSAQSVELLLMNLKGTLQELQINCSSMQDSRMIHFPRMEKLVMLHMIISVPWKNVYTLFTPSIEYHYQFPVLETLKLELAVYHDFGFIHYFFPANNGSVCRSMRELDISFSGYRDDKFIGIVAKIFPNLVKLRLDGYGNRILASICHYLQNLEYFEMYLIYGFNVDDQLTGVDRKICNEIRKSERYLDFKVDDTQVLPSLANLTKLSTLKIKQKDYQAKFWPQAQCITDITGYFALSKIRTLRHLHIESVKV